MLSGIILNFLQCGNSIVVMRENVFIPKRFMLMFYRVKRHDAYNCLLTGSYNFYIKMKHM